MKLFMKEPKASDFSTYLEYQRARYTYEKWENWWWNFLIDVKFIMLIILFIVAIFALVWGLIYLVEWNTCRVNMQLNPQLSWKMNFWEGCLFLEPKTGVWFSHHQLSLILGLIK